MLGRDKLIKRQEGEILAYRWLAAMLFVEFGVRLPQGKYDARNYVHKVWRKNCRHVPDNDIVNYQERVRQTIRDYKGTADYKSLLFGTATPALILDTQVRYKFVRGCRC